MATKDYADMTARELLAAYESVPVGAPHPHAFWIELSIRLGGNLEGGIGRLRLMADLESATARAQHAEAQRDKLAATIAEFVDDVAASVDLYGYARDMNPVGFAALFRDLLAEIAQEDTDAQQE